ncbi:MAG: chorismate-binding protein [Candidatus Baltobacteraceae bacterium]
MRVVIPGAGPLTFESPVRVLRAHRAEHVEPALLAAQDACERGLYCAGYISYEAGSGGERPLLALGLYREPLRGRPEAPSNDFTMGVLRPRITRDAYGRAVREIARAIYDGDVYQVNYTVPFDFAFKGDPYALFCELLARSAVSHAAYIEDGNLTLLSLSPELFLEIDGRRITTKPMKGTAPLDRLERLHDPKNRAEHLMIVDLLRNDLHRICSDVTVPELYSVETYPTFATMTSTVRGTLQTGATLSDIFRATFPCGSITGAPKHAAMQAIAQAEASPREMYTGTIGYQSPSGYGRWNVAIRTLQIDTEKARGRFDAGGGIVADSSAADEWDEIVLKSRFLESTATPFALLETFAAGASAQTIDAHFARLARSAAHFGIPADVEGIRASVAALRAASSLLIRLRVEWDGTFSMRTEDVATPLAPVRICLVPRIARSGDPLSQHKSSWRKAYDGALAQAVRAGCFEAILSNERDELVEGTRTSLFVEIDGTLLTPPRTSGALPGILRETLLRQGRCTEQVLYEPDLHRASAVYVGNSARGLLRAELAKELTGV